MIPADSVQKILIDLVAEKLHSDKYFEAAKLVSVYVGKQTGSSPAVVSTKAQADELLTGLLHWCLNNDGYAEAAQLLWGPLLFDTRPDSAQRVWRAFEQHNFILLMGGSSQSKSYSMGVRLMLEWIRDPEYTTVKVLGPSENHLEDNLFSHLVTLHTGSSIPLPGHIGKLFIGLDARSRKSSISGVVIPVGRKSAGRIQGAKRLPRKKVHVEFGRMSRMFIFLDEIANIPVGIWRDIDNIVASAQDDFGLKVIGAFNPSDREDEVGARTEPPKGWGMFDPDRDFGWTSVRGWFVVRLDPAHSENVVQKKTIYPGLQTWEGFQMLIKNAGGMDSPGYWSMGRGCFPPTGTILSIIPAGLLADIKAEFIWLDRPTNVGGVDLALEGGDSTIFVKGCFGLASGCKYPPSLLHPDGHTVMFKDSKGRSAARYGILVESIFKLAKGDTPAMTLEVIRMAKLLKIAPEHLMLDRTGNGQGVYDLVRTNYGCMGLNFSESASNTRIMVEDEDVAEQLYERAVTEVWFALRKYVEFGYLKLALGFETTDLYPQLTGRRYKPGLRSKVEEKPVYKNRSNGRSPDEADAVTLLLHGVRKASGFIAGMTPENATQADGVDYDDYGDSPGFGFTDLVNRFEEL